MFSNACYLNTHKAFQNRRQQNRIENNITYKNKTQKVTRSLFQMRTEQNRPQQYRTNIFQSKHITE